MHLERRPFDADVHDPDEVREALMAHVHAEIRLAGEPHARLYLIGDGHVDTLDLEALITDEPGAHVGATVQRALARPGVEQAWLVALLDAEDQAGAHHRFAVLGALDGEYAWWVLPYTTDANNGIGLPGEWRVAEARMIERADIVGQILAVPAGAKSAEILAARKPELDLRAAFFDLPEHVAAPADARSMAEFGANVTVADLLAGAIVGTAIVKVSGHKGELWVLGETTQDPDDLLRAIAARAPVADGLAICLLALFEGTDPPQKGVQIVAEQAGERAERWLLLAFPDGPTGEPVVHRAVERILPIDEDEGWLGVAPLVRVDLFPINSDA